MLQKTLLVLLLIFPAVLSANEKGEMCSAASELAETIMRNRQDGVSMAKMMSVEMGELKEAAEILIISAYEKPRFSTEKNKNDAVADFRDSVYLECIKAYR